LKSEEDTRDLKHQESLATETRLLSTLSLSQSKPNDSTSIEKEFLQFRDSISNALDSLEFTLSFSKTTDYSFYHPNAALHLICEDRIIGSPRHSEQSIAR
jgi:hypothetical protein